MGQGETFDDLVGLFRRYVRQETVEPLRSLGRYLLFGTAGSVLVGVGTVLLALGVMRGLQAWGALDGRWSWVPYLAAALPLALVGVRAASLIGKNGRFHG